MQTLKKMMKSVSSKRNIHAFHPISILMSPLSYKSMQTDKTLPSTSIGMILVIFFTVVHAPSVIANIIKRARKRSPMHRMALQWLDPSSELRMLLCLRGPQDVSSIINFMEISRGTADPGIMVYVTDMIELTDQIAATLVHGEMDNITVTDKAVTEMRDQITSAVQSFVEDNGDGITLRRMLALSPLSIMPRDICNLAEDLLISLIILPFHKCQRADGTFDAGHPGFRFVNRKVILSPNCSDASQVHEVPNTLEILSSASIEREMAKYGNVTCMPVLVYLRISLRLLQLLIITLLLRSIIVCMTYNHRRASHFLFDSIIHMLCNILFHAELQHIRK